MYKEKDENLYCI